MAIAWLSRRKFASCKNLNSWEEPKGVAGFDGSRVKIRDHSSRVSRGIGESRDISVTVQLRDAGKIKEYFSTPWVCSVKNEMVRYTLWKRRAFRAFLYIPN
jgi:hypothetical protein